ncbi:MAG TPA: 6-pyruvoyl-tetrahydropterin synthase-related protein, partial [Promineifilum sp.]|nr:6-pyruvoyl-tetrahydropterin synthase-related protein [Promineifilum sp.]
APNFYHAYGYPIFNYYAPLTYYLALPLELLPQFDATAASKAVLVAGMLLAGLGIYGFARDNWGRRAGYVAAALYVYAPYLQYVDPHIRGALPEVFSFAVFPLALWALDRLRRRPTPGAWVAAAGLVAAVILSHNLMGLFFYGLLFAWVLWQMVVIERRPAARLLAVLLVGLGLAAFFWLPVILERDAVNLTTLIGANDNYDFHTHFVGLVELLGGSLQPDWGATQPAFRFNLGVAQWLAGLLGVVMLALGRVRHRPQVLFFALAAAAVILLMTPLATPIWEALPFLPYFQFPWRLLGGAAALLAVLGAAGVEAVARAVTADANGHGDESAVGPRRSSALVYSIAVALPMLFALSLSQPTPWAPFGEVNTARMSQLENSGRWLGTTSTADYVPATVEMLPPRRPQMVDPLAVGEQPDRVNREAMPDGAVVVAEYVRPLTTRYHVTAPKQFRLRLYQFDFPGWQVTIDGEPATTELAAPEGLIVVLVPQGEHVVTVHFGSTAARTLAWGITTAALLLAAAGAWRLRRRSAAPPAVEGFAARADWPIVVVAAAITLAVIALEPLGLFHVHSQNGALAIPATAHPANFGDQIALLGYHAGGPTAVPGETVELTLFWQAQRPLDIEYQVFVHVLGPDGQPVAQSDKINPGDFPTHRWPMGKYVPDTHRLTLPADLPPGSYPVVTGLWVQSEGWRLPVFDAGGAVVGDAETLFTLEVR